MPKLDLVLKKMQDMVGYSNRLFIRFSNIRRTVLLVCKYNTNNFIRVDGNCFPTNLIPWSDDRYHIPVRIIFRFIDVMYPVYIHWDRRVDFDDHLFRQFGKCGGVSNRSCWYQAAVPIDISHLQYGDIHRRQILIVEQLGTLA